MFVEIAHAAGPILDPNQAYDIDDVVRIGVALVVLVSGFLSVLFIIWGGLMLILSGGKEEKVQPAINSIRYAVVGIIVVVLSLFVLPRLGDLLGLDISTYLAPKTIFSTIQDLSARIFGGSSSSSLGLPGSSGQSLDQIPANFSDL